MIQNIEETGIREQIILPRIKVREAVKKLLDAVRLGIARLLKGETGNWNKDTSKMLGLN